MYNASVLLETIDCGGCKADLPLYQRCDGQSLRGGGLIDLRPAISGRLELLTTECRDPWRTSNIKHTVQADQGAREMRRGKDKVMTGVNRKSTWPK